MLYYLLQVFVIDWIKLCHGITIGFRWTHGQHNSCTRHSGTDRLSNFLNFGSEEGCKFITGLGVQRLLTQERLLAR